MPDLDAFYRPQPPAEMLKRLDAIRDHGRALIDATTSAAFRDAWIGATLGTVRSAETVALVKSQWPDFVLGFATGVESFEATEAMFPGRKRGDEIKRELPRRLVGETIVEPDPEEEIAARTSAIPGALRAAAEGKARKHYAGRCSLAIYLNLVTYGDQHEAILETMRSETVAAHSAFDSVWVLWGGWAYRAFP